MNPGVIPLYQNPVAFAEDTTVNPVSAPNPLVDKFQALLTQGTPQPPAHAVGGHDSIIEKAVTEQAGEYRSVPDDLMYSMQHMSDLSIQRLTAVNMTLQFEVANLDADLQVKMATVQSAKEAMQTLMKNQ